MIIRRYAFTGLITTIVFAVLTGLTLYFVLPARGGAHEIELQGVDGDALAGFARLLKPDDRSPSLSTDSAVAAAGANKQGAEVLETVLVRLVNDSQKPPLDKLAWAVNFDPTTIEAAPAIGPIGAKHPLVCDVHPEYDVVFIDAQTGELIFELQYTAGPPGDDPSATCPAKTIYPSPTAVPGQPTAVPYTDPQNSSR